jgi:hypothetical protein
MRIGRVGTMSWLKGDLVHIPAATFYQPAVEDIDPQGSLMTGHVMQWMLLPLFDLVLVNILVPDSMPESQLSQQVPDGRMGLLNDFLWGWIDGEFS